MKNIFLSISFIISLLTLNAQDIIVKNDKTEVKAKIEELTETTIKYKKWEMLDGPSYNINKRDVFMIIYKNGTKEYIESSTITPNQAIPQNNPSINSTNTTIQGGSSVNSQATQSAVGHSAMKKIRRGYYEYEGKRLKYNSDYMYQFDKYGYKDLSMKYKEGKTITAIGTIAGGVIALTGAVLNDIGILIGGGLGTLASGLVGTGIRDNAIKEFNSRATVKVGSITKINLSPVFYSNNTGTNAGFSIRF